VREDRTDRVLFGAVYVSCIGVVSVVSQYMVYNCVYYCDTFMLIAGMAYSLYCMWYLILPCSLVGRG
jgi:hypothetical protein